MFFVYIGIALFSTIAHGAPVPWDKLVEETAAKNPELKAAAASLESTEFQVRAAHSGFFPQLSASMDYNYGTSGQNGPNVEPLNSYSAGLGARLNLFSGLADRARVDQARATRETQKAIFDTTRAQISYDLRSAFAGLSYAQKAVTLSKDIMKRRESNQRLVDLRFQSGRENKGSALLSRAYFEQAKLDNLQATNSLEVSRAQLARVLGRESGFEAEVDGMPPLSAPPDHVEFEKLVVTLPEYRQAVAQEKGADAALDLARSGYFPTLDLTGNTTNTGREIFPSTHRWALGVSLTFPFFSGGRDFYASRSSKELLKSAAYNRQNTLRVAVAKLKQALASYREAIQKFQVDRAFTDAASTRATIARQKYNNGLLTFEDWDIIENDLITRQNSLIRSERDRLIAEAAWEQLLGKGIFP